MCAGVYHLPYIQFLIFPTLEKLGAESRRRCDTLIEETDGARVKLTASPRLFIKLNFFLTRLYVVHRTLSCLYDSVRVRIPLGININSRVQYLLILIVRYSPYPGIQQHHKTLTVKSAMCAGADRKPRLGRVLLILVVSPQ